MGLPCLDAYACMRVNHENFNNKVDKRHVPILVNALMSIVEDHVLVMVKVRKRTRNKRGKFTEFVNIQINQLKMSPKN